MIYPIVVYGSPVLRKVARQVEKDQPDLKQLVADLFETMYVSDGVGLAAPQIGKSLRLFVIDGTAMAEDDATLNGFKKAFINPTIVEETGDIWTFTEGCLSLPKLRGRVVRPAHIEIRALDRRGNKIELELEGYPARVAQHEIDHLDGVLFIDRMKSFDTLTFLEEYGKYWTDED